MARLHFHARQQLYNLTSGMFFRPTLIITTLSIVAIAATISLGHGRGFAWLFPGEPSAAQLVLSTIASSMMTVVSVVYSILLVALSLASMQFSTRVLRHFIRDKVSQQTLGVFVGTFVYCLLLLRVVQSQPTPVVPELGVGIAIVLALVAMAQLVYFIHHISQFIQANHLVDSIANEAETVIDAVFPSKGSIVAPLPAQWSDRPRSPVISSGSGYVQLLDEPGLAQIARALDGVIVVHVSVGHFATKGLPIAFVHSNKSVDERTRDAIVDCFDLGPIRTMQDDAEWGVRQIVDIALKAISPAVNDPSTAATCIDQLGRLLVHAALRADPPDRYAAEGESVARVLRRRLAAIARRPRVYADPSVRPQRHGRGPAAVARDRRGRSLRREPSRQTAAARARDDDPRRARAALSQRRLRRAARALSVHRGRSLTDRTDRARRHGGEIGTDRTARKGRGKHLGDTVGFF